MTERLITDMPEFFHAVDALRRLSERNRYLAMFASIYWDDETILKMRNFGAIASDPPLTQLQ